MSVKFFFPLFMLITVGLRLSAALAQQTAQTESSGVKFPTCSQSSIEREWLANFYLEHVPPELNRQDSHGVLDRRFYRH